MATDAIVSLSCTHEIPAVDLSGALLNRSGEIRDGGDSGASGLRQDSSIVLNDFEKFVESGFFNTVSGNRSVQIGSAGSLRIALKDNPRVGGKSTVIVRDQRVDVDFLNDGG